MDKELTVSGWEFPEGSLSETLQKANQEPLNLLNGGTSLQEEAEQGQEDVVTAWKDGAEVGSGSGFGEGICAPEWP